MRTNGEQASGQDWGQLRDVAREQSSAAWQALASPIWNHTLSSGSLSWRKRYNLMKGSTHRLCHNLTQLGYFRHRNKHARYQNVYFARASSHLGAGMPTAMVSGRLAAQHILDFFQTQL